MTRSRVCHRAHRERPSPSPDANPSAHLTWTDLQIPTGAMLLLPALIFLAKVIELTLSTVRTILVVSGLSIPAATVGFLEIIFGVVAMGLVVSHLNEPLAIVAFAAGFSTGIIVGTRLEEMLALGFRMVFIVNIDGTREVSVLLRDLGYRVTRLGGAGRSGAVEVAFTLVRRHSVPGLMTTLRALAPGAFATVIRTEHFVGGSLLEHARWTRWPWMHG